MAQIISQKEFNTFYCMSHMNIYMQVPKLIGRLTKMILPNVVTKGYLKSYDNKSKTANQIIKEANNFGKVIAMGQRQQRLGTLRPNPSRRG